MLTYLVARWAGNISNRRLRKNQGEQKGRPSMRVYVKHDQLAKLMQEAGSKIPAIEDGGAWKQGSFFFREIEFHWNNDGTYAEFSDDVVIFRLEQEQIPEKLRLLLNCEGLISHMTFLSSTPFFRHSWDFQLMNNY